MSAPPDPAKALGGQKITVPRVHPVTDAEVAAVLHDNPTSVHKSWDPYWHEQIYLLDHGEGAVPMAYRHRGGILVHPDYVLPQPKPLLEGLPTGNLGTGTRKTRFAALPEYGDRKPIMGTIVHIIDAADVAAALYAKFHREGQVNTLGSSDPGSERAQWRADGGKGDPPMAWVRAGDGAVRFNFAKFPRPNLGGHTSEPIGPLPLPGERGRRGPQRGTGGSGPTQKPMVREWARLPEFQGKPPIYGADSRVVHVIHDRAEAQRLWDRLVAERQLHILEYPDDVGSLRWSDNGGVGPTPMAYITVDGVIRFNTNLFRPGAIVPSA